jgi:hypothetical protein
MLTTEVIVCTMVVAVRIMLTTEVIVCTMVVAVRIMLTTEERNILRE